MTEFIYQIDEKKHKDVFALEADEIMELYQEFGGTEYADEFPTIAIGRSKLIHLLDEVTIFYDADPGAVVPAYAEADPEAPEPEKRAYRGRQAREVEDLGVLTLTSKPAPKGVSMDLSKIRTWNK